MALHLFEEFLDGFALANVGRDADGFALDVGDRIEAADRLVDALVSAGFARRDDDERGAGEEEGGCGVQAETAGSWTNRLANRVPIERV